MKAELYTTPVVFDVLAEEWDTLIDPNRSDYFFMTLDWQRTWWEHLSRGELSVVTVRDDTGKLVGIGPWFIEEVDGAQAVRTIGCTEVADYLDTILLPGEEEAALRGLMDFMLSPGAPKWDAFILCNILESSPILSLMPGLAEEYGLSAEVEFEDVCPIVNLPDDYEAYLEELDKKQRHELRRKRRRAEAYDGLEWYVVGDEHDLQAEIETFLDLMARSTPEKASFLEIPGHAEFFRAIGPVTYQNGNLELIFLSVAGTPVAAMWQFVYRDRVLLYNSGLDAGQYGALSPGIVLLTYSVEHAIQEGYKIYDFLQGDETYKMRMGGQATSVHNLIIRRKE